MNTLHYYNVLIEKLFESLAKIIDHYLSITEKRFLKYKLECIKDLFYKILILNKAIS